MTLALCRSTAWVEDGQSYRVICVHCVDRAAVAQLAVDLRRELHGNPAALALCDKVRVATLPPLDTCLVAFPEIVALAV
jgi:hypothetical protein